MYILTVYRDLFTMPVKYGNVFIITAIPFPLQNGKIQGRATSITAPITSWRGRPTFT